MPPRPPKPEPEPDLEAMTAPELVAWIEGAAPHALHEFPGTILVRIAGHVRELEERLAQPVDEGPIRKDERDRLARLFEDHADVLRSFAPDGLTIELLAFLLRLDHG